MLFRLSDARLGAKVDLQRRSTPWRIEVERSGDNLALARRAAVTADLVAAGLVLTGQEVLPADSRTPPSLWVGSRAGPGEALWVRPGPVSGEFGGIDDSTWRLLCLQHHYREPLVVDGASRGKARSAALRLKRALRQLVREAPGGSPDPRASVQGRRFTDQIYAALLDDLATPEALVILWQVLDHDIEPGEKLRILLEANRLLGLGVDQD